MNLYEFKLLELNDQAQSTWDNGVLIGFREESDLHMVLYRIENFYVEIQYHTNQNEIIGIKSFISDERLKPYLEKIDLQKLLGDI